VIQNGHPEPSCDPRRVFRRHGLRFTPQRRAIYETLCATTEHPTAETIFRRVSAMTDSVSLATVYNTLEALIQAGLVRKIPSANGCCRYDANVDEHLHVQIAETGEIVDVPHELGHELLTSIPREVIEKIERATGATIESINVQFTAKRGNGAEGRAGHHRSGCCEDG
jgi:Fur family transcriptional regulator, peroxide stress response regulator